MTDKNVVLHKSLIHFIKIVSNTPSTAAHPVPRMSQKNAHVELASCVIGFGSFNDLIASPSCERPPSVESIHPSLCYAAE
jgi:hypothetical protein